MFFLFLVFNREYLLDKIGVKVKSSIEDVLSPLQDGKNLILSKQINKGSDKIIESLKIIIARYTWLRTRGWMITVLSGLFIGFSALLGSALLFEQNQLIKEQNENLIRQIELSRYQMNFERANSLIELVENPADVPVDYVQKSVIELFALVRDNMIQNSIVYGLNVSTRMTDEDIYNVELNNVNFVGGMHRVSFEAVSLKKCELRNGLGVTFEKCYLNDCTFLINIDFYDNANTYFRFENQYISLLDGTILENTTLDGGFSIPGDENINYSIFYSGLQNEIQNCIIFGKARIVNNGLGELNIKNSLLNDVLFEDLKDVKIESCIVDSLTHDNLSQLLLTNSDLKLNFIALNAEKDINISPSIQETVKKLQESGLSLWLVSSD